MSNGSQGSTQSTVKAASIATSSYSSSTYGQKAVTGSGSSAQINGPYTGGGSSSYPTPSTTTYPTQSITVGTNTVPLGYYLCPSCGQYHAAMTVCPYTSTSISIGTWPSSIIFPYQGDYKYAEPDVFIRYSNKKKCPKCDAENDKLALKFCAGESQTTCAHRCERRDHIHITCGRCKYEGLFLAVDAPENDDEGND